MVKIKVLKLKDILLRFLFLIVFILIFFIMIPMIIQIHFENNRKEMESIKYIDEMTTFKLVQNGTREDKKTGEDFLKQQLGFLKVNGKEKKENTNHVTDSSSVSENTSKSLAVQKISEYKIKVGSVVIRNEGKVQFDIQKLMEPSNYQVTSKDKILLYHTHTSESYTSSEKYVYAQSDYYRTEDSRYNVVRVGEELARLLEKDKFIVIHDKAQHDYPSYNGSYKSSLRSIEKIIKENNRIKMTIDIHRDAIGSDPKFRPYTTIGGKPAAQLMFVVGTNAAGLEHDNWIENLKFAILIQEKANEMYPGLFRELHLSSSRYNQHVTNGSVILEVGATGNTMEECLLSMKYFEKVLKEIIK